MIKSSALCFALLLWANVVLALPMRQILHDAASQVGVPALLLESLCETESSLRWWIRGDVAQSRRSWGLCPIQARTATSVLLRRVQPWELMNPILNAEIAARYLLACFARFGYWSHALACYTGGKVVWENKLGWQYPKNSSVHKVWRRWQTREIKKCYQNENCSPPV